MTANDSLHVVPHTHKYKQRQPLMQGVILLRNTQHVYKPRSVRGLLASLHGMMQVAGVPAWDLGVWLSSNEDIQEYNREYRGKDKATDVLSFPFYHHLPQAGQLPTPASPDDRNLGDLIISGPAVVQHCTEHGKSGGHLAG